MPYKDPETQRAYKREWTRMDRAGECGTPGGTLPMPFRLQTARDVLLLIEEQVGLVRNETEAGTLEKARLERVPHRRTHFLSQRLSQHHLGSLAVR